MREYGKLATRMWDDTRVIGLASIDKLVFIYLLAGRETNAIGCFRCTPMHIAASAVCEVDQADEALDHLDQAGLIKRDAATGVIFIPRFLRYNPISNSSAGKAAAKAFASLPETPLLHDAAAALENYKDKLPQEFTQTCGSMLTRVSTHVSTHVSAHVSALVSPSYSDSYSDSDTEGEDKRSSAPGRADRLAAPSERDREREDEWDRWAESLKGQDGNPPEMVTAYLEALQEAVGAYYTNRGGRGLTPTRRARIAAVMGSCAADAQLLAIEIYADRHHGDKDERYLTAIARRLNRLAPREFEAEIEKHRRFMAGRGLAAECEV